MPPSGPRSITQSALLITSVLCSMTMMEWPCSISASNEQQLFDIVEMQAGSRLVEDEQYLVLRLYPYPGKTPALRAVLRHRLVYQLFAPALYSQVLHRLAAAMHLASFFSSVKNSIASSTLISRTS